MVNLGYLSDRIIRDSVGLHRWPHEGQTESLFPESLFNSLVQNDLMDPRENSELKLCLDLTLGNTTMSIDREFGSEDFGTFRTLTFPSIGTFPAPIELFKITKFCKRSKTLPFDKRLLFGVFGPHTWRRPLAVVRLRC